ncbi:MAG: glycoside hydrolase family 95-like protein, partial [Verrucomicrobiota bacterium]
SQVCDTNGVYEIELLPALPKSWAQGHVVGLRGRGGFEVEMNWADNRLKQMKIKSLLGNPLALRLGDKLMHMATHRGQVLKLDANLKTWQ